MANGISLIPSVSERGDETELRRTEKERERGREIEREGERIYAVMKSRDRRVSLETAAV